MCPKLPPLPCCQQEEQASNTQRGLLGLARNPQMRNGLPFVSQSSTQCALRHKDRILGMLLLHSPSQPCFTEELWGLGHGNN